MRLLKPSTRPLSISVTALTWMGSWASSAETEPVNAVAGGVGRLQAGGERHLAAQVGGDHRQVQGEAPALVGDGAPRQRGGRPVERRRPLAQHVPGDGDLGLHHGAPEL
jgi:hypothetical protein